MNLGNGALERWEVGGHALLAAGITPCLFRAPLDNDLGGSGKTSFAARYPPAPSGLIENVALHYLLCQRCWASSALSSCASYLSMQSEG